MGPFFLIFFLLNNLRIKTANNYTVRGNDGQTNQMQQLM